MTANLKKYRWVVTFSADLASFGLSYALAFLLRFGVIFPFPDQSVFLSSFPLALITKSAAFYFFGVYRGLWRYASVKDIFWIAKALVAGQVTLAAMVFFTNHETYPRSILILDFFLTALFVLSTRFAVRATREWRYKRREDARHMPKVLIFGAGDLGEMIARELTRSERSAYDIAGFIDDDPSKWHHYIHGIQVLGGRQIMSGVIDEKGISSVIIAVNHSRGRLIKDLMALHSRCGSRIKVEFKTVPTIEETLTPKTSASHIRRVELSDLLQRKPVRLDMQAVIGTLTGKTVLVTGAGGTIGGELCRQVLKYKPKKLLMLENHNTALFYIDREVRELPGGDVAVAIAGDVRDENTLDNLFSQHAPDVVFHAAAHKHVPLMEDNPQEAVKNNTLGTLLLVETAVKYKAERFLYISTDKAVRPSSVMGASKRLGEMVIRASAGNGTKVMSVRFGNVLGSSGSVVKLFQEQIANGGPITVTDPHVTRYFMTTGEAIQLILQACSMGHGGEIFVLNMGEPGKVVDLAKNLIVLNGLEPGADIEIKYTGLRPGEKMYE
ncbi:MAG: nucleoside-diphosphate sugar epimerase/dehydratase, partial [Elusimicrobiales bacterium]|nr:nucleoside-diphosphate sugar epimerase/dehydratase [Elusimicrobiales bacterium]